jgi:hypothetical protein
MRVNDIASFSPPSLIDALWTSLLVFLATSQWDAAGGAAASMAILPTFACGTYVWRCGDARVGWRATEIPIQRDRWLAI